MTEETLEHIYNLLHLLRGIDSIFTLLSCKDKVIRKAKCLGFTSVTQVISPIIKNFCNIGY